MLVVWVVALLSLLAAGALQLTMTTRHIAESMIERMQLEAVADGAINLALKQLIDPDSQHRWKLDGTAQTIEFKGRQIALSISDEAGKVDVNNASMPLIQSMFEAVASSPREADAWFDATSKYLGDKSGQDSLGSDRLGGRRKTFKTLDEFLQRAAVPPDASRCVLQSTTLYTGLEGVDRRYASPPVKRALGKVIEDGNSEVMTDVNDAAQETSFAGRIVSIVAVVKNASGNVTKRVVVRLTGDSENAVLTALWGYGDELRDSSRTCR